MTFDIPESVPVAMTGLGKRFGDVRAVDDVSLTVAPGELVALVGPSGSGKTTLLRMLAGFARPDAGTIAIGGRIVAGPAVHVPPERRSVGLVFQADACFPHLTVRGNVAFGLRRTPRRARRARVDRLLALVGMEALADRHPHELSGGQRQRVALARALAPRPSVVLLDEPFAHLDAPLRAELRLQLRAVLAEEGATAVLVTHDRIEALSVSDRVAVLAAGRLRQVGPPREVFHAPADRHAATILGDGALLPGRLRDGALEFALGRVPARAAADAGGPVHVLVRPDDVALVPDPAGAGRVLAAHFLGGEVAYEVGLGGGERLLSHARHRTPLAVGSRVRPRLRAHDLAWWPADTAPGTASG